MNKINSPFDKESILYDNHDYNYQDDPRNKCGYESIWLGLKCKDSSIIEKYKLYEIADLYKLFRYGNNEYPSLYENENVKKIINSKGDNFRQLCYEFKAERLDKDVDGAWEILPLLASIYLEICIFANPIKSKVTGKIVEIDEKFIKVELSDQVFGFIKKINLSRDKLEQKTDRFAEGEQVDSIILSIDQKSRSFNLSIKEIEIMDEKEAMSKYGSSDSGASLGDILGSVLKKKN